MQRQTILVVDDDPKIRALLREVLGDEGFDVRDARNTDEATAALSEHSIDLVTLDIHLGRENGFVLAREIRKTSGVPIIMLTARGDVIDRVVGLEIGADDYIAKPFHVREVVARVRSVLRRAPVAITTKPGVPEGAALGFDGMCAYLERMELVDRNGDDCELTSGDFKLLRVFLERPHRVLSRDQLMDLTGGAEHTPLDRTVDNQVARLRKKIERNPSEPKLIKTVRGVGYVFAADVKAGQIEGSSFKSA